MEEQSVSYIGCFHTFVAIHFVNTAQGVITKNCIATRERQKHVQCIVCPYYTPRIRSGPTIFIPPQGTFRR